LSRELDLIPPFVDGETLTIQRSVNGQNVLMIVVVREPCSLAPPKAKKDNARIMLNGWVPNWGVSAYADARVSRQAASIERLLTHLQKHCMDNECPHRDAAGEDTP
jgi:hypothetical protein